MENSEEILSEVQKKLIPFQQINPTLQPEVENEKIVINAPWEDDSISFEFEPENDLLFAALNQLIFPPPLSAVFHTDTYTFEFIFSVLAEDDPLWSRKFDITYKGETYNCWYGDSTERLKQISCVAKMKTMSSATDFRNLRIYKDYYNPSKLPSYVKRFFENKKPISFFLGPIQPQSTDQIVELARHLNFYMFYFDRFSPQIEIHKPEEGLLFEESKKLKPFPENILATQIDTYILDLWTGAYNSRGRLSFLYYYQILEYAAFYYIEGDVRLRIEKLLKRPDLLSKTSSCLSQVIDEIVDYRQSDEVKLNAVIKRTVNPQLVWGVIEDFKDYFNSQQCFDGGFCIEPFIKEDWTPEDFDKAWMPKIPDKLRTIRNALVHSRESRVGQVIAPTRANNQKLIPWVKLIEEIASQVAIFRSI